MLIAPVEYICRVCGTETVVYVSPRKAPDNAPEGVTRVIDVDGHHRIATAYCEECDEDRVHVINRDEYHD